MNQKETTNGLSNISTDTNRDSESAFPTLAGQVAADCENLGNTLRNLANKILAVEITNAKNASDRHILIDAIQSALREDEALRDALWGEFQPQVQELIKQTMREASVDIDAQVEVNSASLRV
mgnify:FL=1|tara:strand:+ start:789 stop:1154 length:366 start_codon:yes stop_codon:yes gene_type:complete